MPSGINRDGPQRLLGRDGFVTSDNFTASRAAGHGRTHETKRFRWIHRRIGVKAHPMPVRQCGSDGHETLGAFGSDDAVSQLGAVVIEMIDVETRGDAESCSTFEIFGADQGAVFESPSVIRPRVIVRRAFVKMRSGKWPVSVSAAAFPYW